ncbi:MAG: alkaline phosphatase [Candidatus Latescibacterota bacterium]|jgi:alkaline phosphatase
MERVPRSLSLVLLTALLLGLGGCNRANNVILFIGDGTGLAQMAAARIAAVGPDGRLAIDGLEHLGLVTTHSADGLTTDSAAGATAFATGHKTKNGWLSVAPDGRPLKTLVEYARDAGLGTGLVTTTGITHATPAAFAAHVADRGAQSEIARQMVAIGADLMLGGGRAYWIPKGQEGSTREDSLDVLAEARTAGYRVVTDRAGLLALEPGTIGRVLGLFALSHLTYTLDADGVTEPSLAEMTGFAIDRLKRTPKGFFLMVEGGRIDHACHGNDGTRAVWEALALDQAIARAAAFARADGRTLVLFVADHETGGMTVANGYYDGFPQISRANGLPDRAAALGDSLKLGWTTTGHTGIPVIAAAMGPGSERVKGVLDNTELFDIALQGMGLKEVQP